MAAPFGRVYLPLAEWPELDRDAWAKAHTSGGYFNDDGLAAKWSQATESRCEIEYGRLLLFQSETGRLRKVARVGDRVAHEEDLRPFIEWLRAQVAPKSVLAALGHIAQTVRALDPTFERDLLMRARRWFQRNSKPVRKIDDRLIPPHELWSLGAALMEEAEDSATLPKKRRAVLYRDGLLICFLAICPLRRRNVAGLREAEHLDIEAGGSILRIPAEQMKTRARDYEATLTVELLERIRRFWFEFRPFLAWRPDTDETILWLTMRGTSMAPDTISDRIERILRERKRRKFSTHLFRHSAATFIADVAPHMARIAIGVLGHTQLETTNHHYIRGQQTKAYTMYQDEVEAIVDGWWATLSID